MAVDTRRVPIHFSKYSGRECNRESHRLGFVYICETFYWLCLTTVREAIDLLEKLLSSETCRPGVFFSTCAPRPENPRAIIPQRCVTSELPVWTSKWNTSESSCRGWWRKCRTRARTLRARDAGTSRIVDVTLRKSARGVRQRS